jgi:glycosyltransferase involved in cell wall biosynthesis
MKILMLLPGEFPPDIRVENEAVALSKLGHEVVIVCQTRKPITESEIHINNIRVVRYNISKFNYKSSVAALSFPFYFWGWSAFLTRLIKKETFDAIHIHDLPLAKVGIRLAKKINAISVLDLHENWPALLSISEHTQGLWGKILSNINKWKTYEKSMCHGADKIIVVVDEAKARLVKYGIPSEKTFVVSNTLNIESFSKIPHHCKNSSSFRLFYGGGINKHRGLQTVIRALARLQNEIGNIYLDIVGDGRYIQQLKTLSHDLGVIERITFHGHLPFQKMVEIMVKADVALIPHIKSDHTDATIPHKLFQYMYSGIPILSSDCEPLKRIINESRSGLIYESGCPDSFIEKLFELKNVIDNQLINTRLAKDLVINKYNWEFDSLILAEVYKI